MFKNNSAKLNILTNLFLLLIVFSLVISLLKSISKVNNASSKVDDAARKLAKLEGERIDLEEKLKEAESEFSIEKQIRDKLGLAKEGEIVLVLPPPDVLRKLAPADRIEEETLPDPIWKKWARLFSL